MFSRTLTIILARKTLKKRTYFLVRLDWRRVKMRLKTMLR